MKEVLPLKKLMALCVALILCLCVPSLAGAPVSEPGVMPIVSEPVTLSVFLPHDSVVSDMVDNDVTRWIQETTGITLDCIVPPVGQTNDKKVILMTSGDYPDCFIGGGFSNTEILQYAVQDQVFIPLNDLIEKHGLEVKRAFEEMPTLRGDITAPDGNIYGLPNVNECYHCSIVPKMWINTAFMKTLNLQMPTTTDELYQVFKAMKEGDPNGNGKADEIPVTGAINTWYAEPHIYLMGSFVEYNPGNFFIVKDGKITFSPMLDEFRDGLAYVNKLYSEGLIDPAAYTQVLEQLSQAVNGETEIVGGYVAGHVGMGVNIETPRTLDYDVLIPMKGPKGVQSAPWGDVARVSSVTFVITDKCQNPEVAFRLADFMYSELCTANTEYGLKGVAWDDAGPDDKGYFGNPATRKFITQAHGSEQRATENTRWYQSALQYRPGRYRSEWQCSQDMWDISGYELRLNVATQAYEPYRQTEILPPLYLSEDAAQEIALLSTNINDYVRNNSVLFITGEKNVENDWDAFKAGLEGLSLERYLGLYQEALDAKLAQQ